MRRFTSTVAALVLAVSASPALANVVLDLDPGVSPFLAGGPGTGRSIYLTANSNFDIKGFSILGNLVPQSFDVVIYAGQGVQQPAGGQLAIATSNAGNNTFQWNDIAINFSFQSGLDYIINWRPSTSNNTWGTQLEYYSWGNDPNDDVNLGLVTIRDGREGFDAGSFSNTVVAHHRLLVVPAPGAVALLGLAGLVGTRRRRA